MIEDIKQETMIELGIGVDQKVLDTQEKIDASEMILMIIDALKMIRVLKDIVKQVNTVVVVKIPAVVHLVVIDTKEKIATVN
jgi:hypothetical protein